MIGIEGTELSRGHTISKPLGKSQQTYGWSKDCLNRSLSSSAYSQLIEQKRHGIFVSLSKVQQKSNILELLYLNELTKALVCLS